MSYLEIMPTNLRKRIQLKKEIEYLRRRINRPNNRTERRWHELMLMRAVLLDRCDKIKYTYKGKL